MVRLREVAKIELAAVDYSSNSYLDLDPAVALAIFQRPGSNALSTAQEIRAAMEQLAPRFPAGVKYTIVYDPTQFIQESVNAVQQTILEAILLVVLVIVVFLQTWRAAIIPLVAIPISLIGTFFIMAMFGFTLNNLTLFGLVLAVGIVVDDAIVVVENVERNIEAGLNPRDAAIKSMDEVGGALIAIALVLCAVFVPAAFITGISGQFYRQFALTIAGATVISLIVSLTLSPALAAMLLKPHGHDAEPRLWQRPLRAFARGFNRAFDGSPTAMPGSRHVWCASLSSCWSCTSEFWRLASTSSARPNRIYPRRRSRVPDHRHATAARLRVGEDRRGQPPRRRNRAQDFGGFQRGEHCRLLRCDVHGGAERRCDLRRARRIR